MSGNITKVFDVYICANIKYKFRDSDQYTISTNPTATFEFYDPNKFILTIKDKEFYGFLIKEAFYESEIIIQSMRNEDGEKIEVNFKGKGVSGNMASTYDVNIPGLIKGLFRTE